MYFKIIGKVIFLSIFFLGLAFLYFHIIENIKIYYFIRSRYFVKHKATQVGFSLKTYFVRPGIVLLTTV